MSEAIDILHRGRELADVALAKVLEISEVAQIARAEERLREFLLAKWTSRAAQARKRAAAAARAGKSARQIAALVRRELVPWEKDVSETMAREVERIYYLARIAGWKKATRRTKAPLTYDTPNLTEEEEVAKAAPEALAFALDPTFDLVDEEAVAALQGQQRFWIGNHYDANLSARISDVTREAMVEAGENKGLAGAIMEATLAAEFAQVVTPLGWHGSAAQYFEGLTANAATVARVHGQIRSFTQIGITRYEIVNPVDERTCPECSHMNGKVFTTEHARTIMENELAAESKDAYQAAHPWLHEKELKEISPKAGPSGAKDEAALAAAGFALPPFHFRCRCTVDVSEDAGSWDELQPEPGVLPELRGHPPELPKSILLPKRAPNELLLGKTLEKSTKASTLAMERSPDKLAFSMSRADQVIVRREMNALMEEFGLWNDDLYRAKKEAGRYYSYQPGMRPNAVGVHHWEGTIGMERYHESRSAEFFTRIAKGERPLSPAALRAKTLVHESIHGCSPMASSAYAGAGKIVEEATTEAAARYMMIKKYGYKWEDFYFVGEKSGSYESYINSLLDGILEVAEVKARQMGVKALSEKEARDVLMKAAIKMRQPTAVHLEGFEVSPFASADGYVDWFSQQVELPPRFTKGLTGAAKHAEQQDVKARLSRKYGIRL